MPRVKIPRKSTWVDMTAFVDVAFLILAFFILTTKEKPNEPVPIMTPSSVFTDKDPTDNKDAFTILIGKKGEVYMQIPDDKQKRAAIIENVNNTRQLGLTPAEITKLVNFGMIGSAFDELKSVANGSGKSHGIPVDSTGGELVYWVRDVRSQFDTNPDEKLKVYIKGDSNSKYPAFGNVLEAMKNNDYFNFKLVTDIELVPQNSELFKQQNNN